MQLTQVKYNEVEALYRNGNSQGDIAKMLTSQGYRTKMGKDIHQSNVSAFILSKGRTIVPSDMYRKSVAKVAKLKPSIIRRRAGTTTRIDQDFAALALSDLSYERKTQFYKQMTQEL